MPTAKREPTGGWQVCGRKAKETFWMVSILELFGLPQPWPRKWLVLMQVEYHKPYNVTDGCNNINIIFLVKKCILVIGCLFTGTYAPLLTIRHYWHLQSQLLCVTFCFLSIIWKIVFKSKLHTGIVNSGSLCFTFLVNLNTRACT